jgi:hypothetical protein
MRSDPQPAPLRIALRALAAAPWSSSAEVNSQLDAFSVTQRRLALQSALKRLGIGYLGPGPGKKSLRIVHRETYEAACRELGIEPVLDRWPEDGHFALREADNLDQALRRGPIAVASAKKHAQAKAAAREKPSEASAPMLTDTPPDDRAELLARAENAEDLVASFTADLAAIDAVLAGDAEPFVEEGNVAEKVLELRTRACNAEHNLADLHLVRDRARVSLARVGLDEPNECVDVLVDRASREIERLRAAPHDPACGSGGFLTAAVEQISYGAGLEWLTRWARMVRVRKLELYVRPDDEDLVVTRSAPCSR